jgi:hypothetical protein
MGLMPIISGPKNPSLKASKRGAKQAIYDEVLLELSGGVKRALILLL